MNHNRSCAKDRGRGSAAPLGTGRMGDVVGRSDPLASERNARTSRLRAASSERSSVDSTPLGALKRRRSPSAQTLTFKRRREDKNSSVFLIPRPPPHLPTRHQERLAYLAFPSGS